MDHQHHAHTHAGPEGRDGENGTHHQHAHDKHAGHSVTDFLKRFVISTIVSVPVLLLSPMIQHLLGFDLRFTGDRYVLFALSTFVFVYGGYPFLKGLYDEVRHNAIGMMTLIGVAITVAWSYSVAVTFGLKGMDFYWEMATLIDIMLIGHYLEMKSVTGASRSLELLVELMPSTAHHLVNGMVHDMPVSHLKTNDLILIRPGEKVPVDGLVVEGESHVNESMVTGESVPVKKKQGDKVIGGAVNENGSLTVRATSIGRDSYLQKVIKLVEEAQKTKSKTQHFADRAAKVLTFVALGGGIATLIVWLALGHPFVFALERMVSVMVISCPHALGLAVPLVVAISTTMAAKKGLLIRNRAAFENARLITTIIFDKTGTLTRGSHELDKIGVVDQQFTEHDLLQTAAAVERHSEHYIAQGIVRKANATNVEIPKADKFNYLPGHGVEGIVDGRNIKVVGPNYLIEKGIALPGVPDEAQTIVYVLIDGKIAGYLAFSDQLREESLEAIRELKEKGIRNLLLTGDNERVAEKVSRALSMDGFMANVLPHQKSEKVAELQRQGEFVAMTGDGVNDAPALAIADVGIAVGSGTDVAAETADIILVNSNPKDIVSMIRFGKATYRKMIQNLWCAAGYNIVAIPLAAGVLYNWSIMPGPAIGAVLMSLSTIVVALNAQTLKRSAGSAR